MVALIDQLKGEYGARSRGRVLEMLLQDLLDPGDAASDPEADPLKDDAEPAVATGPDEVTSLVLISTGNQQQGGEDAPTSASGLPSGGGSSGIDLPGFVSKRTSQLKATLRSPQQRDSPQNDPLVSTVDLADLRDAEVTPPKDDDEPAVASGPDEVTSLVLISTGNQQQGVEDASNAASGVPSGGSSSGIDLPGFVSKRTSQLKATLRSPQQRDSPQNDPLVSTVDLTDLREASAAAEEHWRSLYGQPPGPTVIEAAMTWLARDVWSSTDASDGRPFTWSAANAALETLCASWESSDPSLGRVMVVAGALEDPFATSSLAERMPTLIRRFVCLLYTSPSPRD